MAAWNSKNAARVIARNPADTEYFALNKHRADGFHNQCKKCNRKAYLKDRQRKLQYQSDYRAKKPLESTRAVRDWRKRLREEMLAAYGGECACCGETESRFLTIDHRMGGGRLHLKMAGGNYKLYLELKETGWPKDLFRLLCWNCNFATRKGETCPHDSRLTNPYWLWLT